MLTVRGRFEDGKVLLEENVPFDTPCNVLITFLDPQDDVAVVPQSEYHELSRVANREATHLTERECEILSHLQQGMTNREIAMALELSVGTIRNHTSRIYQKLDVRNRTEAVTTAGDLGLLDGHP